MDEFALRSSADKEPFFSETAARMGSFPPTAVEKDFWVCWTLKHLFEIPTLPALIFRGGTSLAKVFGVIDRFSEDVDLVIDRQAILADENDPENQPSKGKRRDKVKLLRKKCLDFISCEVLTSVDKRFRVALGKTDWRLFIDSEKPENIHFEYPLALPENSYAAARYIRPVVRMELGCRGDLWPENDSSVRPFVAAEFPDEFQSLDAKVRVLAAERTFWEKVTLVHAVNYSGQVQPGHSRHFYDLARLFRHAIGARALKDSALPQRVREHKEIYWAHSASRYDLAKAGTFKLLPPDNLIPEIRRDYRQMSDMCFGAAPDFDSLMGEIKELETVLNGSIEFA